MIKVALVSFLLSITGLVAGGEIGDPCPGCGFETYESEEEGFVFGVRYFQYDTSPPTGVPNEMSVGV